jgi:hypothetical protein
MRTAIRSPVYNGRTHCSAHTLRVECNQRLSNTYRKKVEKVAVVALTDAGVEPDAVVVEPRHADIADGAVLGPRELRGLARDAVAV